MQKGINQANLVKQTEPSTSLLLYLALFFAATASAGSLFFSEVMKLPPCVLCWYQRIAMYPLVLILGVSIVRKDHGHIYYGLPLAIIGLAIAVCW